MSDAEPNEQSSEDSEQSEEKPADSEQSVEESDASDQSTEQSDEQSSDSDQAVDQSAEQSADSDQPAASATADNTLAFAGAASPGGGGTGVQARPGSQPKRPPRAPVKHDLLSGLRSVPPNPVYLRRDYTCSRSEPMTAPGWQHVLGRR